jgi:hypothetical protein
MDGAPGTPRGGETVLAVAVLVGLDVVAGAVVGAADAVRLLAR